MAIKLNTAGSKAPKPKIKNGPKGNITITIPSTAHTAPKPKTVGQWIGNRLARSSLGKHWVGRATRGVWRFGRREAEGWRDRREARAQGRDPKIPTRRSKLAQTARKIGKDAVHIERINSCGGCGQTFTARGLKEHTCSGSAQKTGKDKAAKTPAPQPSTGGGQLGPAHAASLKVAQGRSWRRQNRKQRQENMTRGERFTDRAGRLWGRVTNNLPTCVHCGWTLRLDEAHECQVVSAPPPAPAATPPGPQGSPGSSESNKNGKGPAMANGTTATNGSAGPAAPANTADAAAIVAAWSAWNQAHPKIHQEMTAKMAATRQAVLQAAAQVRDFQAWMVRPRQNGGGGFHPLCAQPLTGAEARFTEGAVAFTETVMTIERVYAAILEHHRSGTPDPGQEYLSDGRVKN